MYEHCQIGKLPYLLRKPETYKNGNKYPVVFLFHGSGSRGFNLNTIKNNSFMQIVDGYDYEFITIAPQCHENSWIEHWEDVKQLVDEISEADFCDADRIYAIGPSMGGYAVWQIAISMPHIFAAIIPLCAGGMYWNANRLKNIPIWAFHGVKDEIIDYHDSEKMVNAVNKCGGNARLTLYHDLGHEIWETTYKNREVFEWMLSQRRYVH